MDTTTGEEYMFDVENNKREPVPKYSTSISDSHRIVDYFGTKGWMFRIQHIPEGDKFRAAFFKANGDEYSFYEDDNMPMAICLAALATIIKYKI